MSQILKHRKVKRSQKRVLVKKRHFMTNYPETKSYKPLCKKLQSNNHSLAKALSKQKHESQLLFSQNVALIAEVQDLVVACSKRDAVLSNIQKNAKEMLKMIVTMTGFVTNIISCCQEYVDPVNRNMRMACSSAGRRESSRRLSIKSPTKGVVKPMVSGHTITKPTINLSRVNMQHINNPSNLSIISEVPTPPRNQELNTSRSPNAGPVRQSRFVNGRTCRLPERLTAASQRDSDENEQRLSEGNNRYSGRISGRLSKSRSRLSRSSNSRYSGENFERIGSPTVKLNDVSKLLQNSQSINLRMLTENQNNQETNNIEVTDNANQGNSQRGIVPETTSEESTDEGDSKENISRNDQSSNSEMDITDSQEKTKANETRNRTVHYEDPLEGPSWLFNDSRTVPSFCEKTDNVDVSNDSDMSITLQAAESSTVSDDEKSMQQTLPLPMSSMRSSVANESRGRNSNCKQADDESEYSTIQQSQNDDSFCNMTTGANVANGECKTEETATVNLVNFVTQRRGYFESEDDEDEFTLMLARKRRNMHFDINDLKLPVLEQSTVKPVVPVEPEPEVTATIRKISQICPIPSVSHNSLDETAFNQSTVKLPMLMNNDCEDKELTPLQKKPKRLQRKRNTKKATIRKSIDFVASTPLFNEKNNQKKKKNKLIKDPSAAKVVLEKLNESDVNKSRTPSPNETISQDSNQSLSPASSRADALSDSDSNTSTNSQFTANRPRRKRAPLSLYEPSLKSKLRRNH